MNNSKEIEIERSGIKKNIFFESDYLLDINTFLVVKPNFSVTVDTGPISLPKIDISLAFFSLSPEENKIDCSNPSQRSPCEPFSSKEKKRMTNRHRKTLPRQGAIRSRKRIEKKKHLPYLIG